MCKVYIVILLAEQMVSFMYPTWLQLGRSVVEKLKNIIQHRQYFALSSHVTFRKTRKNGISNCAVWRISYFLISFPNRKLNEKNSALRKKLFYFPLDRFLANCSVRQYFLFKFYGFKNEILMIKKSIQLSKNANVRNFMGDSTK